jgi:hypothetical protein
VAVVAICVADLPLADLPLWQLAQPVVMPVWSNLAPPANEVVELWQVSQAAVVGMWLDDLPFAVVLLWQLAQPLVIGLPELSIWLKPLAGVQALFLWQVPQSAVVATWFPGLPTAEVPL